MYEHVDDFKLDALNCGTDYYADASLTPQNIDKAFKIYQHAKKGTTLLDAWLLGSIHANTEFHFASPLNWSNFWDENLQRITVTAREIIGITAHGYEIQRPSQKLEAVAVCINRDKAMAASLISYKDRVKRYVNRDVVSTLLR